MASKLDQETRMTIQALARRGQSNRAIARLLAAMTSIGREQPSAPLESGPDSVLFVARKRSLVSRTS